jgi:hypothetical protein
MRTVVASGGDLYHLALQYLGGADQWNRIAQANNLLDPLLVGTVTLQIPSVNAALGGGVLVR